MGKGSRPRPCFISEEERGNNYEDIFGSSRSIDTITKATVGGKPCICRCGGSSYKEVEKKGAPMGKVYKCIKCGEAYLIR